MVMKLAYPLALLSNLDYTVVRTRISQDAEVLLASKLNSPGHKQAFPSPHPSRRSRCLESLDKALQ